MAKVMRNERLSESHNESHQFDKIMDSIHDLSRQISDISVSQKYTLSNIERLNEQVSKINERNLKQDTILSLISKLWKISPYIVCVVFLMTLSVTNTSFHFSAWAEREMEKLLDISPI